MPEFNDKVYKLHLTPHINYETSNGEIKTDFDDLAALALLMAEGVVFINNHWWEKEFSENQKRLFSINVNINDCFGPGSDAEEIMYDELEDFFNHWERDNINGVIIWVAKKRKMMPLPYICKWIKEKGIWDLQKDIFGE